MSLCSAGETGMRADTKVSWTSASFWNMSVVTPPLVYATAPAKLSKKSLYSSNGSRKTTSGRAHVNNAAHGASHSSGLPNVRGNTGPLTHSLCRDLVPGGPKLSIAVKDKPVNRPNLIRNVLVGKTPRQISQFILDFEEIATRQMMHFVKGSRAATNIVVHVTFEFSRNKMSNTLVTVKDDIGNIYMKLCREDLECTSAAGNSAPLNWIATVPIDAEQFPTVYIKVNDTDTIQFDTKNEIYEIFPEGNVIACLIFKNVRRSLCYNWQIVQEDSALRPGACAIKYYQEARFNFFEEMLGMNLETGSQLLDYKAIVDVVSKMDSHVLEFNKISDHITNALCINASTPLLDDMTFTAKSKSLTIRGAITRQNVVDSIRFDETMPYFDERLEHEFDDAYLHKISVVFTKAIYSLIHVRLCHLSWTSCYTWMHQEELGGSFESNCHRILELRVHLCRLMTTLQNSTPEDKQACAELLVMALMCMDTSLVHNIDVLCGIKDVLHDVCLPSILMKSKTLKPCSLTNTIHQFVHETMGNRVSHNINRSNTPFAQMKSPLTNFVLKQILLDSMRLHMQTSGVPPNFCQIKPYLNQPKNQQCQFEPDPCEKSVITHNTDDAKMLRAFEIYCLTLDRSIYIPRQSRRIHSDGFDVVEDNGTMTL